MVGKEQRWFGPSETARRLGVTTKTLRVYEREGLVLPNRAESGWRLYGPSQLERLHQIIVLRDLGLPLKSIKKLIESQSRIREVLRIQRKSLELQQAKISYAIELIKTAECRLDEGQDLSLDDLAILTKETVVQQPISNKDFRNRIEARVLERDPTGEASTIIERLKQAAQANNFDKALAKSQMKAIMAEARHLMDTGDTNSETAKQLLLRLQSLGRSATRQPGVPAKAELDLLGSAVLETIADAQAKSEALPIDLTIDPVALGFLREVERTMKERGELA